MIAIARLAVVAACMAKGLTPAQTERVWSSLEGRPIPESAFDTQQQLEEAIHAVVS